ncbi:alpha/beta fold hydrolase [Chachezhania sediminis]|uniref:alpha/beta fold hydrolase n=1 Tax=Chachezhania sediminis TaxID=2599291 RepID=UPI00131A7164|nr:alpha/beta fold hydrolase [Chachezhania sediminis]
MNPPRFGRAARVLAFLLEDLKCLAQTRRRRTDRGDGAPILMIIGLGFQLIRWPKALIDALAAGGHRVIAFDNRDSGRSTFATGPGPTLWQKLKKQAPGAQYDLSDMAGDAGGLLTHLGIDRAHVVGMSMGGMIGQVIAARYPTRVLSLTLIFSTTGSAQVGQPDLRVMLELARKPRTEKQAFIAQRFRVSGIIGGPGFPADPDEARETFALSFDRTGPEQYKGVARQIGAILASGDRTTEITTPTLVIHGDRDPLVHPSGGQATAHAIPGARHVTIAGMGHEITRSLSPTLANLILTHTATAEPAE